MFADSLHGTFSCCLDSLFWLLSLPRLAFVLLFSGPVPAYLLKHRQLLSYTPTLPPAPGPCICLPPDLYYHHLLMGQSKTVHFCLGVVLITFVVPVHGFQYIRGEVWSSCRIFCTTPKVPKACLPKICQ